MRALRWSGFGVALVLAAPVWALPCGDLDRDADVDGDDAALMQQHLAGSNLLDPNQTERCDVIDEVRAPGAFVDPLTPECSIADAVVMERNGSALPPDTARGSTVVFDRSGTTFDGSGGALAFSDFFPIRTLSRAGRELAASTLPGTPHPPADYTQADVVLSITESYGACVADDSLREIRRTYWRVVAPGTSDSVTLPTPPAGWPRATLGGDLAGLIDANATPEDDVLVWTHTTVYEGLHGSFDYDQIRLFDFRSFVTHATTNEADY